MHGSARHPGVGLVWHGTIECSQHYTAAARRVSAAADSMRIAALCGSERWSADIYVYIYLPINLSTYLSIYLPIYQSIDRSIYGHMYRIYINIYTCIYIHEI